VKGKGFCERPFELHRQQPEKNKQNFDVAHMEKLLWTPMITTLRGCKRVGMTTLKRSLQHQINIKLAAQG